ncbi:hypothetical protein DLE60_24105 [Micromonospora globispora]|nr:hypothetical protein DLE60_24105 [Micromonospora globispora]
MVGNRWWRIWRTRWVAGGLALLAVATIGSFVLFGSTDAAVTASPSLPRRLGAPSVYTPDARHTPIGAASVVFTGGAWGLDGSEFDIALTGLRNDAYRTLPESFNSTAGITAILSPNGTQLAVENGIVNLATGTTTRLPPDGGDYRHPEAWSLDGRYLATVTYTQPDFEAPETFGGAWTSPVTHAVLSVVDTSDGHETTIADVDMTANFDGWLAAFSPDGTKLAYQSGNRIVVVTPAGAPIAAFAVPAGTRIAGKGAWTRDGSALAVVAERPCGCGRTYDARWTLTTIDASTGATMGTAYIVDGVVAIRVLGWTHTGRPVVATYDAGTAGDLDPSYQIVDFRPHSDAGIDQTGLYMSGVENLDNVFGTRVLVLAAAGPPQVLLASSSPGAESVDIADDVIAGSLSRAGHPPLATFDRVAEGAACAVAAVLFAGLVAAIIVLVQRLHRSRRHRRTGLASGS